MGNGMNDGVTDELARRREALAERERRKAHRLAERDERQRQRRAERESAWRPAGARPIGADLFTIDGYGPEAAALHRSLDNLSMQTGDPAVQVIDGGVVATAVKIRGTTDFDDGAPDFASGIFDDAGNPVDLANLQRGRRKVAAGAVDDAPSSPVEDDREVVYLGHLLSNHFGRFLLETLARCWVLEQVDPGIPVVFHAPRLHTNDEAMPRWQGDLLAGLGIPPARIVVPTEPTRFRRVIVPEALFVQQLSVHERFGETMRMLGERMAGNPEPTDQPLYLSRRRLSSLQRPLVGEDRLEELLADAGVLVVSPERLPIAEQIRLMRRHRRILSPVGSAAHAILFAANGPELALLANGVDVPRNFMLCSAAAAAPTTLVNAADALDRPLVEGAQATPQFLHIERVAEWLRESGWANVPTPAAPAADDAETRRRFAYASLAARLRTRSATMDGLPPETEREATAAAAADLDVAWALATHYAARQDPRLDEAVRGFVTVLATEPRQDERDRVATVIRRLRSAVETAASPDAAAALAAALDAAYPATDRAATE